MQLVFFHEFLDLIQDGLLLPNYQDRKKCPFAAKLKEMVRKCKEQGEQYCFIGRPKHYQATVGQPSRTKSRVPNQRYKQATRSHHIEGHNRHGWTWMIRSASPSNPIFRFPPIFHRSETEHSQPQSNSAASNSKRRSIFSNGSKRRQEQSPLRISDGNRQNYQTMQVPTVSRESSIESPTREPVGERSTNNTVLDNEEAQMQAPSQPDESSEQILEPDSEEHDSLLDHNPSALLNGNSDHAHREQPMEHGGKDVLQRFKLWIGSTCCWPASDSNADDGI